MNSLPVTPPGLRVVYLPRVDFSLADVSAKRLETRDGVIKIVPRPNVGLGVAVGLNALFFAGFLALVVFFVPQPERTAWVIGVGTLGCFVVGLLLAIGVYARRTDAALPEVLRADSTTITLPREGAAFPRASLVLLEVVSFNTVTSSPRFRDATGHRHLIACVRDDSGLVPFVVSRHAQAFERLAPGLAEALGVPLCRRRLGDYEVDFTGALVRVVD